MLVRDSITQAFTPAAAASSLLANGTIVKFTGVNLQNKFYCIGVGSTAIASIAPEPAWSKLISLQPNPAQQNFTLTNISDANIQLFDLTGKLLAQWNGTNDQQIFDLPSIENGSYFVRITRGTESTTKKLMIQK